MDIIDCDIWNVYNLIYYIVDNCKFYNRIVLSYLVCVHIGKKYFNALHNPLSYGKIATRASGAGPDAPRIATCGVRAGPDVEGHKEP